MWYSRLGFASSAQFFLYVALVGAVISSGIIAARRGSEGLAEWTLSVGALIVAAVTLFFVLPRPARIVAFPMTEYGSADVTFTTHLHEGRRVPRYIHLDVQIAFANMGNEKGILSRAEIECLLDEAGRSVSLPGTTHIDGFQRVVRRRLTNELVRTRVYDHIEGPYILDPNAVANLHFARRLGIMWEPGTTLASLQNYQTPLGSPITHARVRFWYRSGSALHERSVAIPIRTRDQQPYGEALREITEDFTKVPRVPYYPVERGHIRPSKHMSTDAPARGTIS